MIGLEQEQSQQRPLPEPAHLEHPPASDDLNRAEQTKLRRRIT
jgi:hypothetical protein